MSSKDPRIDAYIAKSADFARTILTHIRQLVHAACPEVEGTMKWRFPHFDYKGMLCSMAAFKQHCSFGFWKGELILDQSPGGARDEGMGHFGRITAISDLPADKILKGHIKKAVQLNDAGVKKPNLPKRRTSKELSIPEDLRAAFSHRVQVASPVSHQYPMRVLLTFFILLAASVVAPSQTFDAEKSLKEINDWYSSTLQPFTKENVVSLMPFGDVVRGLQRERQRRAFALIGKVPPERSPRNSHWLRPSSIVMPV